MDNLILLSALHSPESIHFLERQLVSLIFQKISADILIITEPKYQAEIDSRISCLDLPIKYFLVEPATDMEASASKLRIFEYPNISTYSKVLYLDSAVLFNSPENIFDIPIDTKLYVIEEGWLSHPWWGGDLFTSPKDLPGFSTSVMLFKVCDEIKKLFTDIRGLIEKKNINKTYYLDQPYIIFQAVTQDMYDSQILKKFNENKVLLFSPRIPMVYKTGKMNEYMKEMYRRIISTVIITEERSILNTAIQGKTFRMKDVSTNTMGCMIFKNLKATIHLGPNSYWGSYNPLSEFACEADYGNQKYILLFNSKKSCFISIRKFDLSLNYGIVT